MPVADATCGTGRLRTATAFNTAAPLFSYHRALSHCLRTGTPRSQRVIAKNSAQVTADEIVYLRKQLVIGGSTLDSVLAAEARLYDSEAKEINFLAERQKSQLIILGTLGLLSTAVGL